MTLLRNGTISIVVGAAIARFWGGPARWPLAALLVLWPALGGHCLEVWFLNWLRPRLAPARGVQVVARVAVWFAGGIGLALGMGLTAITLSSSGRHIGPPGGSQASPLSSSNSWRILSSNCGEGQNL